MPEVQWFKKPHRGREFLLENDGIGVAINEGQNTATELLSTLVLRNVDQDDTATYTCRAGSAMKVTTL